MRTEKISGEGIDNGCSKIDSLVKERFEWKSGNYFSNRIIPVLEKESGIEANCDKGTYGYHYSSDSLFRSDVEKWKTFFKCK